MRIRQVWYLNKFIIHRDQFKEKLVKNAATMDPDQLKIDQARLDTMSSIIKRLKELLLIPGYLDDD